jgi:diguanylate cyclase (GGDEF)-like protein
MLADLHFRAPPSNLTVPSLASGSDFRPLGTETATDAGRGPQSAHLQATRQSAIYLNIFWVGLLLAIAPVRHLAFKLPFFPSPLSAFLEWWVMVPASVALIYLRQARLPPALVTRWTAVMITTALLAFVFDLSDWRQRGIAMPRDYADLFLVGILSVSALSIRVTALISALFLAARAVEYGYLEKWVPQTGFHVYYDLVAIAFAMLISYTMKQEAIRAYALRLQLRELAFRDPLTGLPNRRNLAEFEISFFAQAAHDGRSVGLALVDLDRFKGINDTRGHDAGDQALKAVADILRQCAPGQNDFVARVGGDEFLILWHAVCPGQCEELGRSVLQAVKAAQIENPSAGDGILSVSIGAYCAIPDRSNGFDQFRRRADEALYRSKR